MEKWHSCNLPVHIPSGSGSRPVSSSLQEVEVTMWGKVIGQEVGQERKTLFHELEPDPESHERSYVESINSGLHLTEKMGLD